MRFLAAKAEEDVVSAKQVRHLFAGNPGESFSVGMFRKR
jgi:hypothetical protein